MKKYKFFGNDIVRFKYNDSNILYLVVKEPVNIFTAPDLNPWEVYENTINLCWDWNKLQKVNMRKCVFTYYLYKSYFKPRMKRIKINNI